VSKASITKLLDWVAPHALRMSNALPYEKQIPAAEQWGYVFGWQGKKATSGKWAGRWCMDCNGLFEFFLRLELGGDHNTYSRVNYSTWCKGYNGSNMNQMPQIPGTAVFVYGPFNTSAIVHHVGVLWRKIGPGPRDWLVIEAANSSKGVIVSKMGSGWNRWGLMKAKFEYDLPAVGPTPKPTIPALTRDLYLKKPYMKGDDVAAMQRQLIAKGYRGKMSDKGIGELGPNTDKAMRKFQIEYMHATSGVGICGQKTWAALFN
jgi:hypothetical protein